MELRETLNFLLSRWRGIAIAAAVGAFAGLIFQFAFPTIYSVEGLIYVTRETNRPAEDHFTYEGYYSQQAAISYTETVAGFLESIDLQKNAAESLKLPTDYKNLRKVQKNIRVQKVAPQLINLKIKNNDMAMAIRLWEALTEELRATIIESNSGAGDPSLEVRAVSQEPTAKVMYKNLLVNVLIGLVLAKFIYVFGLAFKAYLLEETK